jgi:pSer/pThr/pTyr-binding forkhead associated (FHA) protein
MRATLLSLNPLTPHLQIGLGELPATVGRSSQTDVCLGDRWTSRIHCEISEINGTLVVRDLESKHGTFVNGEQVRQAHLLPGDRLTVGLSSFEVRYERRSTGGPAGVQEESASHC